MIPIPQLSQGAEEAKEAGIGIRFHDLRHSDATQLLRQDIHPKVVSERLGHSTIVLTMDVYSHVLPDMQEAATLKMDAALTAAREKVHQKPSLCPRSESPTRPSFR